MERPSLRQLECVVAVAEHLNFRRAAEACFITQPALSAQLQQLENVLGLKLFERDRRRVLPTPAGAALVARARRALEEIDAFVDAARVFKEPLAGPLRLGVIPTVAPYVLPIAVPRFHKAFPRLKLFLREAQTAQLVELVRNGRLDLLLLALEADLGDLESVPIYEDPFVVAAPHDHPLARKAAVQERDLSESEVLLLEDGHCLRDQVLTLCKSVRANEVDDFRATSLNTLVRMVVGGIGITLLPSIAVPAEVHGQDRIALLPFARGAFSRTIGIAWRRSSPRKQEFALLADVMRAHPPKGATVLAAGTRARSRR